GLARHLDCCLFSWSRHPRARHSFPTRRSSDLVLVVLLQARDLLFLDGLGALVLVDAAPREHLDVDHRAFDAGRHRERRVAHVARSEEHTSELQSLAYLVCRLLPDKNKSLNSTL